MRAILSVALVAVPALAADLPRLPADPGVTQGNIASTICAPGWSKAHRPPWHVTDAIKRRLISEAGLPPEAKRDYELDHRELDLGGLSVSGNLQLEPWPEAREKDRIEVCLAKSVCAGAVPLREAQQAIWRNWRTAEELCR